MAGRRDRRGRPAGDRRLRATAAKALLGSSFRITRQRGELVFWEDCRTVTATVHPSSILRARGDGRSADQARAEARADFVDDLTAVARLLRDVDGPWPGGAHSA